MPRTKLRHNGREFIIVVESFRQTEVVPGRDLDTFRRFESIGQVYYTMKIMEVVDGSESEASVVDSEMIKHVLKSVIMGM
jgi:hypothetical protein